MKGIEKFREYFEGYEDQYAIIGGAACDLLFNEAGLEFRATKDIDMVLCVEVIETGFGGKFRDFINEGGYETRQRSDGKKEYHRFLQPTDEDFPYMIELFARKPGALEFSEDDNLTPISVEEETISLSAILLDDEYYEALISARRKLNGVTIIDQQMLIPFKAKAFLDLSERSAAGGEGHGKHIKKHRNDVFRLVQLLKAEAKVDIPDPIRADLHRFIEEIKDDDTIDPKSFGVPFSRDEGISILRSVYGVD